MLATPRLRKDPELIQKDCLALLYTARSSGRWGEPTAAQADGRSGADRPPLAVDARQNRFSQWAFQAVIDCVHGHSGEVATHVPIPERDLCRHQPSLSTASWQPFILPGPGRK